ncbi:DNA gyrase inhibitor YacG [Azospirillum picis]|uniref:DNA gyrase inhibitor YacG n=1 Tax=Azospirillum picis TaxID=488438 RepID=A0ABU0MDU1_9PROT|nr:DNA gyrase inhibitor YacG [Azospirillum picis]MBP2297381.1 endogenous inhibitor of DNA gyrase (YacG/DUF329 family) [Azospirillum picis]MDQ0531596.1 endogenous inhibitor of DNA gyrase (YacG/DUF329 family) [Azospirillum picis]
MSSGSPGASRRTVPEAGSQCPICGRPTEPATRPFCSKRCADIDLSRWLGGVYRIEGPESSPDSRNSELDED